jgi:hypothetical protein
VAERELTHDRCPNLAVLLLVDDGELPTQASAKILEHVRTCHACQQVVRRADVFTTLASVISEEEREGETTIKRRREREFMRALQAQSDTVSLAPSSSVRRWLPAAALIPLLVVGFIFSRTGTVVRADELLTLAATREQSLPADRVQRVRISLTPANAAFARPSSETPRIAGFTAVRDIASGREPDAWPVAISSPAAHKYLERMLARHGFDWRQPLSLVHYQAWRASLKDMKDEVQLDGDLLILQTTTPEGLIRQTQLVVRRNDYEVVRLTLGLGSLGRLEIEKIDSRPLPVPDTHATLATAVAARPPVVERSPSPLPGGRERPARPALSLWLARTYASEAERQAFVPRVEGLVSDVRQRIATLSHLASRTPDAVDRVESAESNDVQRRVKKEYGALQADLGALYIGLAPLASYTPPQMKEAQPRTTPADWERRVQEAAAHALTLQRILNQLLTYRDLPTSNDDPAGPQAFATTFGALWDTINGLSTLPN